MMTKRKNSILLKLTALLLVVALAVPGYVSAATAETVQPLASDYIDSYNSYICPMGGGRLEIWFRVEGTNIMDDIGALTIMLYESVDQTTWTWVETYTHDKYASMLGSDNYVHSNYVSYQGIPGRYYKARVTLWSGRNGGGDSRSMWTSVKKAT